MKERFNIMFNQLRLWNKFKTQKEAAEKAGTYPSNISKAIKGDTEYLTESFVLRFNKEFGSLFNDNWLLTGEGEMLKDGPENATIVDDPYLVTKCGTKYYELPFGKFRMRVPLVPIEAYAKYIDEYRDAELINDYTEVEFIVDKIGRGKYLAFEVKGDSMDNGLIKSIPNGSIVLARDLSIDHWTSNLRTKDFPFWVIVLDNTILVKEIVEHDIDNGVIKCHSLNESPEYSDFEINLSDVRQLLNIVAKQIY